MSKLITCKDCGHQISKNATQCPNCGAKIKKTSMLTWIIGAFIGVPFLMGVFGAAFSDKNKDATTPSTQPSTVNSQSSPKPTAVSSWNYDMDGDKMRNTKSYFASNASTNSANFKFPYSGNSHLNIVLRNDNNKTDVMLKIDKGQFSCGIDSCQVAIKFDDKPVKNYTFNRAEAGISDVIFLDSGKSAFINDLKTSNKVMIEAPFFNEGKTQFEFKTSGLEWNH